MNKNKKILNLEDIKRISLEGLKYFKKICNENNLQYFLAYGTLIGAVRHKGFIPWDDDIDLWMPREDYNKLINICSNMEDENWELQSCEINNKYLFPWAKLCNKKTIVYPSRFNNGMLYGISIDIFPIDTISKEELKENAKIEAEKITKEFYNKFMKHHPYSGGIVKSKIKKVKKRIAFFISNILYGDVSKLLKQYQNKILESNYKESKYISCLYEATPEIYEKEYFEKSTQLEFENEVFNVPINYEKILKEYYGDYMKLPPKEKRITHHSFIAYFK